MLLLSYVGIFGSISVLVPILLSVLLGEISLKFTTLLTFVTVSGFVSGIDENWELFQAFISTITVFITWVCAIKSSNQRQIFDVAAIAGCIAILFRVMQSVRV